MSAWLINGCGSRSEDKEEALVREDSDQEIQIGVAFDSFLIERWERDRDIFVSRARDLGAAVNVQNANGDVDKQKEQIE